MITPTISLIAAFASLMSSTTARPNFSGDFVLRDLAIESPFQANVTSTKNSTISFTFHDQDLLNATATYCSTVWPVGLLPQSTPEPNTCSDSGVRFWFPEGTYHGVKNFTVALSHSYVDNTVGEYPYNVLTKFGEVRLVYPDSPNYECDVGMAQCRSCPGTGIVALVTHAIS